MSGEREKYCRNGIPVIMKKVLRELIITLHGVDFYDPCTGLAGIELVLPAGIARPAPAEDTLAES